MSDIKGRSDLNELDVGRSGGDAALSVVARITRQKDDLVAQWATAIRLAQANGASVREIANVAGVSPRTVANICRTEATGGQGE